MAQTPTGHGTVLAGRFRLEDLVQDSEGAKFWRATDQTLARSVAVNVVDSSDPRAEALLVAARTSATVTEGHFLRVLDAAEEDGYVYVVHEWGSGVSLDKMLADGPLSPRRAAWVVKEVAEAITTAHAHGVAHGRLLPENVMVTEAGSVKLIGFVVDAVLAGRQDPQVAGGESLSDHEADVFNLAALLYATLVAKWPGSAGSKVAEAPNDRGRPLRPRQVRAGIPRALDAICDAVLNPDSNHQSALETAHEISAALSDYVGDPTAAVGDPTSVIDKDELTLFRAQHAAGDTGGDTGELDTTDRAADPGATQVAPSPFGAGAASDPPQATDDAADADEGTPDSTVPGVDETQAGTPLFFDEDTGVGWVGPGESRGLRSDEEPQRTRRPAPPPPPPLPEPVSRPLFAPGPPRDATRRDAPRPSSTDHGAPPPPGYGTGHGTGSLPAVWGPDSGDERPTPGGGSRDAGKDWLRLALIVAICLALVLAVIIAFNLGRGASEDPAADAPSPGAEPSDTPARPLRLASVSDFDPQSDSAEENAELVPLATDGDPATAWETLTYQGNPELGLLKEGVGLLLDLGGTQEVSEVQLTLQGEPTSLEILAAPEGDPAPTSVEGLDRVAVANGTGPDVDLTLDRPASTQYLVVWLTSLPPSDGGYQGRVAEIVVR